MNLSTLINLNNERQNELKCRVRSQPLYAHSIRRARKVLLAADEVGYLEIAQRFKVSRGRIIAWHDRFANGSLEAIQSNFPRSGRKPHIDTTAIAQVTTQTKPVGTTRWDTRFVEKLENAVGLYLPPTVHLLILYYDEKRRAQELGRTQLALPLKNGRTAIMTHDFKRNGTTTSLVALNMLNGQVSCIVGSCTAIFKEYVAMHIQNSKLFIWPTKVNDILQNLIRAIRKLDPKINEVIH